MTSCGNNVHSQSEKWSGEDGKSWSGALQQMWGAAIWHSAQETQKSLIVLPGLINVLLILWCLLLSKMFCHKYKWALSTWIIVFVLTTRYVSEYIELIMHIEIEKSIVSPEIAIFFISSSLLKWV